MTKTTEIVTFRVKSGHSAQDVAKAAAQMEGFLQETGGMIHRTLSQDNAGLWTDHILWASMEDAQKAAAQIGSHPDAAQFISMIDGPSVDMRHATMHLQME